MELVRPTPPFETLTGAQALEHYRGIAATSNIPDTLIGVANRKAAAQDMYPAIYRDHYWKTVAHYLFQTDFGTETKAHYVIVYAGLISAIKMSMGRDKPEDIPPLERNSLLVIETQLRERQRFGNRVRRMFRRPNVDMQFAATVTWLEDYFSDPQKVQRILDLI